MMDTVAVTTDVFRVEVSRLSEHLTRIVPVAWSIVFDL
jgi:hypothetical protein